MQTKKKLLHDFLVKSSVVTLRKVPECKFSCANWIMRSISINTIHRKNVCPQNGVWGWDYVLWMNLYSHHVFLHTALLLWPIQCIRTQTNTFWKIISLSLLYIIYSMIIPLSQLYAWLIAVLSSYHAEHINLVIINLHNMAKSTFCGFNTGVMSNNLKASKII